MSSVVLLWAWPRMRLTRATSASPSMIRVAGEGVTQVVEAQRRPAVVVDAGRARGNAQAAAHDVALGVCASGTGHEDPVLAAGARTGGAMCGQHADELVDERDLAHGGLRLGRHASAPLSAARHRELGAHVDDTRLEVDVVPDQAERFGDPHSAAQHGRDEQPMAWRAGVEQRGDLRTTERALRAPDGPRTLVALEPGGGVLDDPALPAGVAQDRAQCRQRARARLLRTAVAAQRCQPDRDVLGRQRADATPAERRQDVPVQVVAVRVERALRRSAAATLA